MNRRSFLKGTLGVMALPALESVGFAQINSARVSKRLVCIGNSFGFHAPHFFPKDGGKFTSIPPALLPLKNQLHNCTLFSNLDHGVKGGHFAVHSFLSGVKQSQAASMPSGNLSLDQRAAEVLGSQTRFPSLVVGSENGLHGGCQMSWTRSGVRVPPIEGPRELFRKLYLQDDQKNQKTFRQKFDLKKSILDATLEDAKSLSKELTGRDREKLDEYFTSIREVEMKIHQREKWQSIEKPKPSIEEPINKNLVEDIPILYQLIGLALEMDSTRIASFEMAGAQFKTGLLGLKNGYHAYSHHGKKQENIDALLTLEQYQTKCFAKFLDQLANTKSVAGNSLLDETTILFGSGMGNGNSHTNSDLPILVAGNRFQTGMHKILPSSKSKRVPLSNLYLSILQDMGIEDDVFAHSNGTLTI
tara:strand:- start:950 stop:2197 length:1248 start_codon:yes stop_codon:yes gene_type:complete